MHIYLRRQRHYLVLRHQNDVPVADRALLESDQPVLQTVDVENVVAHWNLQKVLSLFEVLEAESALLLRSHEVGIF